MKEKVLFEERTVLMWPGGTNDTAEVQTKLIHVDMGYPFGATYVLRVNMYMSEYGRRDDLNECTATVLDDSVFTDAAAIRKAIDAHDGRVDVCRRHLEDIVAEIGVGARRD